MKLTGDRCQCAACNEHFNSTTAFDKHRKGVHGVNRHCLTPDAMLAKSMSKNKAGFWITKAMTKEILSVRKPSSDSSESI